MATFETALDTYADRCYANESLSAVIELVRSEEIRILDVGAGVGANARALAALGKEVHAVTASQREVEELRGVVRSVWLLDIEQELPDFGGDPFDAIICSHVLEHLRAPQATLLRLVGLLRPGGRVYVALPNIMFYKQRLQFLCGRFKYTSGGLLDETHLRFYTFWTARSLIEGAGLRVVHHAAVGWVPLGPLRRLVGSEVWVDRLGTRVFPNVFGWHVVLIGERHSCPHPHA